MDHAELRAKVRDYFRAQLEAGKAQRNGIGPFSSEEKTDAEQVLAITEDGNRDYWHLMGADYARAELDQFFRDTGLSREEYRDHTPMVLDEIRKARIGAYKAILKHSEAMGVYDFSEPRGVPLSANVPEREEGPVRLRDGAQGLSATPVSPLLSELFDARWTEADRGGEWSAKITEDYQVWVGLFIELAGDLPIIDYQKADGAHRDGAALRLYGALRGGSNSVGARHSVCGSIYLLSTRQYRLFGLALRLTDRACGPDRCRNVICRA